MEWEQAALKEQNAFCNMLGDRRWDRIKPNEGLILRRKIGYGLYGPPSREPNSKYPEDIGYKLEEDAEITKIYDVIIEEGKQYENRGHTWFACIFISCKLYDKRFTFPVFRILKNYTKDNYSKNNCTFIDHNCRVYENWADYLANNTLPACLIMYPSDGIYQLRKDGKVDCIKDRSCACYVASRTLEVLDYAATAAGIGASAIGLAAICAVPIAGPIMAGAVGSGIVSSGYGLIRSSSALVDRYQHKQSIGLDNAESRNCWLTIVSTPLFFTQFRMIAHMKTTAEAGDIMSKAARITYSVVNIACLTTSGLGIINSLSNIIDKGMNDTLTPLDIYQFTASCVFFTHSIMNFQTASTIIKKFQQDHIDSYKEYLSTEEQKNDFDSIISKMQGERKMHNSAKIIKELNYVENKDDFIHSLVDVESLHNFESGDIMLDRGLINMMDEWKIHPEKLSQIDADSVKDIMSSTKKFQSGEIDLDGFKSNLSKVCSKYRLHSEATRQNTIAKLAAHFGEQNLDNIEMNGVKIFKDMPGHVIDRLDGVMENTAKNYKPEIIDIAMDFATRENCQSASEFCNYLEYSVKYMNDEKNRYVSDYKKNPSGYEKFSGKVKDHFEKFVYEKFKTGDNLNKMSAEFNETKEIVAQANAKSETNFRSDAAATYHFVKHKDDFAINNNNVTPDDYLNIAQKITKAGPESMMLSQEGNVTFVTFKDQKDGMVIGIQPRGDKNCHIATCYRLRKK